MKKLFLIIGILSMPVLAFAYTVVPGDTLQSIGQKLGIDWHSITGYKSGNPNLLYVGENLETEQKLGGLTLGAATSTIVPDLIINSFKTAGTKCIKSVNGLLATSSADCGSGGGGSGSVSTSSPITQFNFPYWFNATGGLSGTSTLFYSSSTGYVGIGTTQPSSTLHVVGTSTITNADITNTLKEAPVLLIKSDGTRYMYRPTADTDAARGTALLNAFANASTTDTIYLGIGTFDITGSSGMTLSTSTNFIGQGINTIIKRTDSGVSGDDPIFFLQSSNVYLSKLQLDSLDQIVVNGSGAYTGIILNEVYSRSTLANDFIFNLVGFTGSADIKMYDCDITSTWDVLAGKNLTVEVYNSRFASTGTGSATVLNLVSGNTIKVFGGVISGGTPIGMQSAVNTVELYGTRVISTTQDLSNGIGSNTIKIAGATGSGANGTFTGTTTGVVYTSLKAPTLSVTGSSTLTTVSSTNLTASGYLQSPLIWDLQGNKYTTSTFGTGTAQQLVVFDGTNTGVGYTRLTYDNSNGRLILGDSSNPISVYLTNGGGLNFSPSGDPLDLGGLSFYRNDSSTLGITTTGFSPEADLYFGSTTVPRRFTFPDIDGTFALGTGSAGKCASWVATNTLQAESSSCGSGGGGSVSTSSPITAGYLAPWANVTGGLNGTSSAYQDFTNGRIGIGTIQPSSTLHVVGSSTFSGVIALGTSTMSSRSFIFGIGTSSVAGTATSTGGTVVTGVSSIFDTQLNVGDLFLFGNQSRIITAIGATTSLTVDAAFSPNFTVATSASYQPATFRVQDNLGNNSLVVAADGTVIANSMSVGTPVFAEDSGVSSWIDESVSSTLSNVPVGYTASIDAVPLMTLYAIGNGSGGIKAQAVGIYTTTPFSPFTVGTSTIQSTTSSLVFFGDGVWINGGSASGTLLGMNTSGTFNGDFLNFQINSSTKFGVASSGVPLFLGTSTISLGGASLTGGTCTSTTTVVPVALPTSTSGVDTYPQIDPGADATFYSTITATGSTTSTITTYVCEAVTATPTASRYNIMVKRFVPF